MPRILIDIVPAFGHFYGTLKIVQKLRSNGYEIIYLNMNNMKSELDKHGFQNYSASYLSVSNLLLTKEKFSFNKLLEKLWSSQSKIVENKKHNLQSFKEFLNDLSPDLILLDEQQGLKALYYEIMGLKTMYIQTMPDPEMNSLFPPFTSSYVPSNNILSRLYCKCLWKVKIYRNYFRLKKLQLNNLGQDDYTVALKIAREYDFNFRARINFKRSFGLGIHGISRLVISPVDFDFPLVGKSNTFNIGPLVDLQREGEINRPRYSILLNKLKIIKKSKEGKVVYCSMGTITRGFVKQVSKFFKKIIQVACLNPNDLFILSTGQYFDINNLFPVPDNIHIFPMVPQIDLLKYCDIMITHGGINSQTECIFHGIPTLVYPLSYEWDQPGNAARTVYHKIGLKGNLRFDSAKKVSKKLNRIKLNYDQYRQDVFNMKAKFELNNQSDKVLSIIQNFVQAN